MRLAISNIAWDIHEDDAVSRLLKKFSVDAIDIAPGKYFPDPVGASEQDISRVRVWWAERGIEITGMEAVCRIGGGLGATRVVFGSPKNRDRSGLSDAEALSVATSFFRRLGDIAQYWGVTICLEPNPVCYGANFMTTSAETSEVVRHVAHPSIRMQLDTGALTINEEDPQVILREFADLIGHVHASEPNLVPLGDGATSHVQMADALTGYLPRHVVSIEMVATKDEPPLTAIERALKVAVHHYRATDSEVGK